MAELVPRRRSVSVGGTYVEVVPMTKVMITFGWEQEGHPIPPGSTTVEITIAHGEPGQTVPATGDFVNDDALTPCRQSAATVSVA